MSREDMGDLIDRVLTQATDKPELHLGQIIKPGKAEVAEDSKSSKLPCGRPSSSERISTLQLACGLERNCTTSHCWVRMLKRPAALPGQRAASPAGSPRCSRRCR